MLIVVLAPAQPAPVIVALDASHVITSINLLGPKPTIRTLHHISHLDIVPQLSIANTVTSRALMRHSATLKAHRVGALLAHCRSLPSTAAASSLSLSEPAAARPRAPLQIWIDFDF